MLKNDDLDEGTINKPKNTPFHNRLEQKINEEKPKGAPNFRYGTPHLHQYQFGQQSRINVTTKSNNIIENGSGAFGVKQAIMPNKLESPKGAKKISNKPNNNKIFPSNRMLNISTVNCL